MRIVSGKYRRRKLRTSPGLTTRPITDRTKEILFERIGQDIENKRIADVFAGTGTLGLEALSRGAQSAVFIENDRRAFELLKTNLEMLDIGEEAFCWRTDVLRTSFRPKGIAQLLPFDTVFFDPPYRMIADLKPGSRIYKTLERLARDEITADTGLLVLRTPRGAVFECPPCWQKDRCYELSTMEIHLFDKRSSDSTSIESTTEDAVEPSQDAESLQDDGQPR